jgi:hypothetical protein
MKNIQPTSEMKEEFLTSNEWLNLQLITMTIGRPVCAVCGHRGNDVHVTHILQMDSHWELRNRPENLQILCNMCYMGRPKRCTRNWNLGHLLKN